MYAPGPPQEQGAQNSPGFSMGYGGGPGLSMDQGYGNGQGNGYGLGQGCGQQPHRPPPPLTPSPNPPRPGFGGGMGGFGGLGGFGGPSGAGGLGGPSGPSSNRDPGSLSGLGGFGGSGGSCGGMGTIPRGLWGGGGLGLGLGLGGGGQDLSQDPMFWGVASRWDDVDDKTKGSPMAGKGGKGGPNFLSQVSAAAAAAVEMPATAAGKGRPRPAAAPAPDFSGMIQKAQAEAEKRRISSNATGSAPLDIHTAQSQAANRRGFGQEMSDVIRNAQLKNIPMAQADAMAAPKWSGFSAMGQHQPGELLGAEDLLGKWIDMQGNSVHVYNTDAFELHLMASMSRPPRPDLQLSIRPLPDGGWHCGNASLDNSQSSMEQLYWISPNGRESVWLRGRE